ncbi:MAG: D-tyrosyl-tRNA(Tyr) deacylase [Bacteroidia bacterium]|nr:D-tyrosyl-tRNA(Tyr) deacylase [Bacteroidia bacterium]
MKIVLQRVSEASVIADGELTGEIQRGLLILLGIEETDTEETIEKLCKKIAALRIFNDGNDKMNLSCKDVDGDYLVISQFTLLADTSSGNRPSYTKAARPETAKPLYEKFLLKLAETTGKNIQSGIFGADMKVKLINDGPVTILI